MSANYELFVPLPATHAVPDPRYAESPDSGFLIVLPLYGAVPSGSADPSDVVPGKYFCFLGKTYDQCYIELDTILGRLHQSVRQNDYNSLEANPHAQPFGVWDNKGALTAIPAFILVDASRYRSFPEWDTVQKQRWATLCGVIDDARPSLPFNVYSRFIQPATDQITLFFTPTSSSPGEFTIDVLKKIFQKAFSDSSLKLPQYPYTVISLQDANARGLVMTGAHYLHFYFTWMTPDDYTKLWKVLQNRPELMRPWPTETVAAAIQIKIGDPPRGSEVTTARMSHFKATASIGQRPNFPDQKTVMNASATDLAKAMWGAAAVSNGSPADAEWLHRNAFHFGGLDDTVNLASSQTRENLVFGTGESNTQMIRVENTISSLLRADASISHSDRRTGTLVTTNLFKGTMNRRDLNTLGFIRQENIPTWVNREQYMWLSLGLRYQWTMPGNALRQTFNACEVFDPFSRFIPLRVEARLDDAIMDYLFQRELKTTIASSNSNSDMVPRVLEKLIARNGTPLPPSTPNEEPTIVWNAAQHHIPHIHVSGSKISNPAIADLPSGNDESKSKPVVHVIGAGPLFSHVTEDTPVQAVRVVQLEHAIRKRQAEALHPPTSVQPSTQSSLLGPVLADAAPTSQPPKEGFVLVGSIDLFGVPSLKAKFEKWEGPAPPGIVVLPNDSIAVERVTLSNDFHFSSVVAALEGTVFDTITFRNVQVYHQNYKFDATKAVGWHFSADLVIDGSCAELRDVLSTVLGVKEPTLNVSLFLGTDGRWDKPPALHSFTLEGVFAGLAVKPIDGVVMSTIGVRLFGIRTLKYSPTPRSALDFGFSVFGSMNLDVPGSTIPLTLDYEVQEYNGTICLGASIDLWVNPLGANGLVLSGVSFSTSFGLTSPWKSLTFGVSADLMYEDLSTTFRGTFSPRGSFDLKASIHKVTVKTIDTLFRRISGADLSLPDADITIGTASLAIVSGGGLSIGLDSVTIGDYTSLDASLAITAHNVTLRGKLTTDAVQFGDVELKSAFLQVTFEKKGSGKTTDLILGGKVAFSTLDIEAAVHLYRSPDLSAKSLEWTVLASLTVGKNALALSKVVPELAGTPFDLALTQAVFVVASRDDPSLGNMITSGFQFHQGVQVCAVLGEIEALNSLMRGPCAGLTISASWSKAKGFNLDVYLPLPTRLNLGNGITTTPFTLSIVTKPTPELVLSAGLNIPVAHSPTPLVFTLSLGANLVDAQATGQMTGWWVNPFGISPNVKIGPNLALSISIIYLQFIATGVPSGFAIQGGLMIGQTQAQLALAINENPMKELLSAEVKSLNIVDVADFAGNIIGVRIPDPPRDFLQFEQVQLYISPAGVHIGTTFYPQGFSFQADLILFGKRANIKCAVDGSNITLKGGVDNFTLGPLTVRGTTGPRAVIECEVGPVNQHLLMDGVVSLFKFEATVHIEIGVLPTPKFDWFTQLKFTDLLLFQLRATLVGTISFTDLSEADFIFDAHFEQNILKYIHDQLMGQFERARLAAKNGIDGAQKELDKEKAKWNAGIDQAQADLDTAKRTWDAKNEQVTTESNRAIEVYNAKIAGLERDITSAQRSYNTAMTNAQAAVSAAERDRAREMQSAQHDVDNARRKMIHAIDAAQRDVDEAERIFDAAFGSAQAAIDDARRKVQSLQDGIDNVNRMIRECENASGWDFWKWAALPGLYDTLISLEKLRLIAKGILLAAEAVLKSADYLAKQTVFDNAKLALQAANTIGQLELDRVQTILAGIDKASQVALDLANKALEATKIGVEWGVLEGAKKALQVYKEAHEAAFHAASQALVDLITCAEYLAYKTATVALQTARDATITLDAAGAALKLAQEGGVEALKIGQWVADRILEAFDIRVVHLSGSLRGMIGADGSMVKPFTAHIEGIVAGQLFALDGELHINETGDFIAFIFKDLWNRIKPVAQSQDL